MTLSKGEAGRLGRKNTAAVNMMAAVSPAALDNPRMEPVRMPGRAEGSSTL